MSAAHSLFNRIGVAAVEVRVVCTAGETVLTFAGASVPAAACLPPGPPPMCGWLWLSPLEEAIIAAIGDGWMVRVEIAERCHEAETGRIKVVLANMVERHILETDSRQGYRVARSG